MSRRVHVAEGRGTVQGSRTLRGGASRSRSRGRLCQRHSDHPEGLRGDAFAASGGADRCFPEPGRSGEARPVASSDLPVECLGVQRDAHRQVRSTRRRTNTIAAAAPAVIAHMAPIIRRWDGQVMSASAPRAAQIAPRRPVSSAINHSQAQDPGAHSQAQPASGTSAHQGLASPGRPPT